MYFEWDEKKDLQNFTKHGISFARSVETFRDPNGVKLQDPSHSTNEQL